MRKHQTTIWTGESGLTYRYWIVDIGDEFSPQPGNYMFIKEVGPNSFKPIYIGESQDLDARLSSPETHEKMECARLAGATHICSHMNLNGQQTRRSEESDLIVAYQPVCNYSLG